MAGTTVHDQIERVAKALPVALAALYVAGFMIVAFRLAGYGASSLDMFRIQYVAAGFWFGMACLTFFLFSAASRPVLGQYLFQVSRRMPVHFHLQRIEAKEFAGAVIGDSFIVALFSSLFLIFDKIRQHLPEQPPKLPHVFWFLVAVAGVDVSLRAWLLSRARQAEGIAWSYEAHFRLLFLGLFLFQSLRSFSQDIYPTLPFPLGGGQTRQVVFWLGPQSSSERSAAEFLGRDGSTEYTVPYELLFENEDSYVVISPKENQRSIVLERKAVEAIVVLGKRPNSAPANFQRNISEPSNGK